MPMECLAASGLEPVSEELGPEEPRQGWPQAQGPPREQQEAQVDSAQPQGGQSQMY